MDNALHQAYLHLPAEAISLYWQLGSCPMEWITPPGLAVLADLPAGQATGLADQAVAADLLTVAEHGYTFTPAQRLHARISAQLDGNEQSLAGARARWLWYLLAVADTAERLITPGRRALWPQAPTAQPPEPPFPSDRVAALDWLETQLPNYLAVLRFGFCTGRYQLVCDLAHRLWPLFLCRGHLEQRYETHLLALAAAAVLKDERAYGEMLTTMADTVHSARPLEAYEYNQQAEEHYRTTGDTLGLAHTLTAAGQDLLDAGYLDQAETRFRAAEQLHTQAGDERGAALDQQRRGLVKVARGQNEIAAALLERAYLALRRAGDTDNAALTLAHHVRALAAAERTRQPPNGPAVARTGACGDAQSRITRAEDDATPRLDDPIGLE
jgi:tetratricopeptide (TPR) repeat protein